MNVSTRQHAWVGWLWRGGRWERACSAEGLHDCSRLLGEKARGFGVPDKLAVMTGGAAPTFTPKGVG